MKFRMSKELRFWVDVECDNRQVSRRPHISKGDQITQILSDFENAGDAMRYLRSDGKIGWKATPRMLDRLAEAEREAVEDAEHDLP
jgi:hypothetical protein